MKGYTRIFRLSLVYIVTFDPVNYRITEGDSVMITAVLDGPAKETVTVQVMIMDISISGGNIHTYVHRWEYIWDNSGVYI